MLIIGLTGGIGSGKSTVAKCFSDLGIPVIDADSVARELVVPGEPALEAIRARFGDIVISESGELDRNRLRSIIFSDPQAKADLEAILHPGIRSRMWAMARAQTSPYVILEIPLLIETGQHRAVDRVLVVDVPEAIRIDRIQQRDKVSRQEAIAAIRSQISAEKRLEVADDVIDNSGPVSEVKTEVAKLNTRYLQLSSRISA